MRGINCKNKLQLIIKVTDNSSAPCGFCYCCCCKVPPPPFPPPQIKIYNNLKKEGNGTGQRAGGKGFSQSLLQKKQPKKAQPHPCLLTVHPRPKARWYAVARSFPWILRERGCTRSVGGNRVTVIHYKVKYRKTLLFITYYLTNLFLIFPRQMNKYHRNETNLFRQETYKY